MTDPTSLHTSSADRDPALDVEVAASWAAEADRAARAMQAHYLQMQDDYPGSTFGLTEQAEYVTALAAVSTAHARLAMARHLDAECQADLDAIRDALTDPGDPIPLEQVKADLGLDGGAR